MEQPKKKILLVDDNEIVRLMFSNVFWLHGLDDNYDLTTVGTIKEASDIISDPKQKPDIVFTGLVMPFEKDGKTETSAEAGFSLLRKIKGNPETQSIRIVIFSNFNENEYREQAIALGAEDFFSKGENLPQDLIKIIRSFGSDANPK
ncbi:MAG: response regulator [Candidatus Yonathbacteria bacterium]|nr:response regulator [Candidatus Yonathbacteria bacterium]